MTASSRPENLTLLLKRSNKAIIIIVDIASPWNHRVYEKDGEKIDKYQDLKREIGKLWGIRQQEVVPLVVGALGTEKKKVGYMA